MAVSRAFVQYNCKYVLSNCFLVDINNAVFESTNAVPDNILQEISQNHQFENEFESNEILYNVDNYAKEVATTAIERVQPFKLFYESINLFDLLWCKFCCKFALR